MAFQSQLARFVDENEMVFHFAIENGVIQMIECGILSDLGHFLQETSTLQLLWMDRLGCFNFDQLINA